MPELDQLLETKDAAKWLGMRERDLRARSKGKRAKIPGFWINCQVVRFHPRTILAKLAADAGVDPEVIAASMNLKGEKQ